MTRTPERKDCMKLKGPGWDSKVNEGTENEIEIQASRLGEFLSMDVKESSNPSGDAHRIPLRQSFFRFESFQIYNK
jgi:hypothetical protein